MNYRTHRLGGVCAGAMLAANIIPDKNLPMMAGVILTSYVGSLIPDIDEPNSVMGKKLPLLSKTLKWLFKHRGIVHTPLFCLIMYFGFKYLLRNFIPPDILNPLMYGFLAGYLSHLLLDTITPKGIMWLWPISQSYISTQSEWFVKLLLVVFTLIYFACKYNFLEYIKQMLL